jgi:hypothetical protein
MKRVTEKKKELLLHIIFQNFKCQNEIFRYVSILAPGIFVGLNFIWSLCLVSYAPCD